MGTIVTIEVAGHGASQRARRERELAIGRAFAWFDRVEATCSRFDVKSELRRLCATSGTPVVVSRMLFEAVRFAVAVAEETNGAFDPAIGARMEARGFARNYRNGTLTASQIPADNNASFRDVLLDEDAQSIMLAQPLLLDLGAVAKGLAIDMAVQELTPMMNFAIDAGGDVYMGGRNADDAPWTVGIRHPREPSQLLTRVQLCDAALCTSGDYERPIDDETAVVVEPPPETPSAKREHHLLDPASGQSPCDAISASVIAPTAMVADALGTAAFILGCAPGISLLERHALRGCIVDAELVRHTTKDWVDV